MRTRGIRVREYPRSKGLLGPRPPVALPSPQGYYLGNLHF